MTSRALAVALALVLPAVTVEPATAAAAPPIRGDVNGDGGADLVVAGTGNLTIQSLRGRPVTLPQAATALSTGDFDGDGLADVATGASGKVTIRYGTRGPAYVSRTAHFTPGQGGVPALGTGHGFGNALTTSDFNRDGFTDLAAGAPETTLGSAAVHGGAAIVLYGSRRGLTAARALRLSENTPGVTGFSQHSRLFGAALAAGDVTGDGYPDLVVTAPSGRPGFDIGGAVHLFKGSAKGVTLAGDTMVTSGNVDGRVMNIHDCSGGAQGADDKTKTGMCTREAFGWSVRAGRFYGGKYADVAIAYGGGRLVVMRGGPGGISRSRITKVTVPGLLPATAGALAAGDIDKDGRSDLVAATKSEVVVLRGSAGGLRESQRLAVAGATVALIDVDGDSSPELAAATGAAVQVHWFRGGKSRNVPIPGTLIAR
ncbi:FG-GAP-like repeat-containing protein [Nonomuraea soli]|uniref:VCBS repeat-containing protein n=1 Tax=Nonomuraea soli TaxID=1032476 RepID=A0A7W0HW57_9ACTN|nr:FG-GAP-like repeat-containing protein [Nonomuraea soli]MBA2897939.1 hypothetical protein [Nonomuraea soli]